MQDTYRILAKDELVNNNTWVTGLNNNDIIIGPSGSGKTSGYVIPNILRMNESMIVADTKGNIKNQVENVLEKNGYIVQSIDFTGVDVVTGYNPFDYIAYDKETDTYSSRDIKSIAAMLVPVKSEYDPFWELAARQLLECLIAYVLECLPEDEQNMMSVVKVFSIMGSSVYYHLFEELEALNPESYAVSVYNLIKYNGRAERMQESIRGVLSERITMCAEESVKKLFNAKDKVNFCNMGKQKTALFLTISDSDRSMDNLINLFYTQAFHELCNSADRDYPDNRLEVPVRFYLDDFAANVFIPDFDKITSVIRSREIYVSVILQSLSQLEGMYGGAKAKTILNNCDHCLYLGGQDVDTAKYISIKANKSASSILNMLIEDAWLFCRGAEPKKVAKYVW